MYGLQHEPRVELLHDDHGGAVRKVRHDAQHATEAVEERNGQRHAVVGSELLAFADIEAVVQDVAVREHDALRKARGAGRVLHHHHVVVVEMVSGSLLLDQLASRTWLPSSTSSGTL